MIFIASQLLFYFFIIPPFSNGADTLAANQSLSGNNTLVSHGGTFELGFFKPGNSSNYYIGIWYYMTIVTTQTVVWVANRDTPISNPFSSRLKILDGNLVLLDELNTRIWSTNLNSTTATDVAVVLLDDGNLVLRYGSTSSPPIWQSFDYPTHTFMPGGKLGYNKRTRIKQILTSWRNNEDPGMGLFSLEIDPNENQYLIKWNTSVPYWSSGSWNERDKRFDLVPEMRLNYIYNFSYVDNENESYFTYSLYNPTIISRFFIDVSGQVKQTSYLDTTQSWNLFWSQPRDLFDVYSGCGALGVCNQQTQPFCNCLTGFEPRSPTDWNVSDFSGGCVRRTELDCKKKEHVFISSYVVTIWLPEFPENEVTQLDESSCRSSCFDYCPCSAYSFISNRCQHWNRENLNNISQTFKQYPYSSNIATIHVKVSSSAVQRKHNPVTMAIVTASIAGMVLVLLLFMIIIYTRKGKTTIEGSLVVFVFKDLQRATKNFSERIGKGGFGSVFKGVLHDSTNVAVKRLESVNQGDKQFRSEVSTIGIIQHVNVVRLRGFCAQGHNKLLVYDYMPNGSLHSHLFRGKQDEVLDWETRYRIALGTAKGLVYLHEKCRDCIIHGDIKPENILLDADFSPKIADFGLAKLLGREFSRVLTTIRGTRGYLAPEWLWGTAITAKADVYSYGMMLFELISGKRNVEQSKDSSFTFFPTLASKVVMSGGDILSLLDSRLNMEASVKQVIRVFKVAYWCIQDEEDTRPSMSQVERILEGISDVEMPTIPQSIQIQDNNEHVVLLDSSQAEEFIHTT